MPRERRIVQVEPPVAAEHRDALGERFERLALHADQRLVAPHQLQPLGHVVEQIGDAAFRVRRGDDAQGAPVGQMPFVLARLRARDRPRAARSSSRGSSPARGACARRAGGRARRNRTARNRGTPASRSRTARDRRRCRTRAAGRRRRSRPPVASWSSVRRCASVMRSSSARIVSTSVTSMPMPALPPGVGAVDHLEDAPRAGDDHRQARLDRLRPRRARAARVVARCRVEQFADCARPRPTPSRASTARA